MQQGIVVVAGLVHALYVNVLGFSGRDFEGEGAGRADLRDAPQNECQDARADAGTAISPAPLFFIIGARYAIEKFLLIKIWGVPHQISTAVQ